MDGHGLHPFGWVLRFWWDPSSSYQGMILERLEDMQQMSNRVSPAGWWHYHRMTFLPGARSKPEAPEGKGVALALGKTDNRDKCKGKNSSKAIKTCSLRYWTTQTPRGPGMRPFASQAGNSTLAIKHLSSAGVSLPATGISGCPKSGWEHFSCRMNTSHCMKERAFEPFPRAPQL